MEGITDQAIDTGGLAMTNTMLMSILGTQTESESDRLLRRVISIAREYDFFIGDDRGNQLREQRIFNVPEILTLARKNGSRTYIVARFVLNPEHYQLTFEVYDKKPPYSFDLFLHACYELGEFNIKKYNERPRWRNWLLRRLGI